MGGDSENEGLLQVCFSGRWETVNGDGWTAMDSVVVCQQLGFNNTGNNNNTQVAAIALGP